MPGPLPTESRRRRNPVAIPTTALPAAGRSGPAPKCPYRLGKPGKAWWVWAWKTPQAAAWSPGDLYALARRAQLEDDIEAIGAVDLPVLEEIPEFEDLKFLIEDLKRLAGGKLALVKEARELDDRFGLTAKSMAALRWKITEADAPASTKSPSKSAYTKLRSVG